MADKRSGLSNRDANQCLDWIKREKDNLEKAEYGKNKRSVADALSEQRHRVNNIKEYKKEVDRSTDKLRDDSEKTVLKTSYDSLKYLSEKRVGCLENISQIANVEDLFGNLTADIAERATTLVEGLPKNGIKAPEKNGDGVPHAAQSCILSVRNNWSWLSRLVRCTEVHIKHMAEYHQFYHDISEFEDWLPAELGKLRYLVTPDDLKGRREDANRLLSEIKAALAIFLTWQGKTDSVFDKAKKIVPVHHRSRKLDHQRPVTSLCNYKTNDVEIQEGEEMTLLDNSMAQSWLIRTTRAVECYVPSVICLIPPPDPNAVNLALRLRLQLLGTWTDEVKRIGKTIIYFLLLVFREWTPEEEEVLKALPDEQKRELVRMCDVIESNLIRYWEHYPDFILLQDRFKHLKGLLAQRGDPKYRNSEMGRALVVQIGVVEELVRRYKDLWSYWETFKILVEVCRHGELMLISEKWEDLKFIDTLELLKRWHMGFGSDTETLYGLLHKRDTIDFNANQQTVVEEQIEAVDEVIEETVVQEVSQGVESSVQNGAEDGEMYSVETAMETAEAEHIHSAEQEERKTFVITGVVDPKTEEVISLDDAVRKGIINQSQGTYVNAAADINVPIPVAMNAGWIKVEYTSTKKTAEKRRDIGLITIKIQRESRPYTVKAVKDISNDRMMSVDEAVSDGLIDFNKNVYKNRMENTNITIADALDSGLLEVEIDEDSTVSEPSIESKTYAIYAVVDQVAKKRIPFGEAVRKGLIDAETGAYYHNRNNEQIYVGDAIKKGFIKASIVSDPKSLDIKPENRKVIEKMQKKLGAISAVNAFRKAGKLDG